MSDSDVEMLDVSGEVPVETNESLRHDDDSVTVVADKAVAAKSVDALDESDVLDLGVEEDDLFSTFGDHDDNQQQKTAAQNQAAIANSDQKSSTRPSDPSLPTGTETDSSNPPALKNPDPKPSIKSRLTLPPPPAAYSWAKSGPKANPVFPPKPVKPDPKTGVKSRLTLPLTPTKLPSGPVQPDQTFILPLIQSMGCL